MNKFSHITIFLFLFLSFLSHSGYAHQLSVSDLNRIGLRVDYLVVAPSYFREHAQRLCEYRQGSPHINSPRYIITEEVYDSFLHLYSGQENPRALSIRHAIRTAYQNFEGLRYVVLFGSGYMEIEDRERENFIPAIYDYSNPTLNGLRITDDLFISDTINYTRIYPLSLSIGRISVNNHEQAQNYLDKLAIYEDINNSGLWKNRILIVADDDLNGSSPTQLEIDRIFHEGYISSLLYPQIPKYVDIRRVYIGAYEIDSTSMEHTAVSQDISSALSHGAKFFVYSGHAWTGGLSVYNVLSNWNFYHYVTNERLTIALFLGCQAGYFNAAANIETSLAEKMVFSNSSGAIAALGSTSFLSAEANNTFGGEFFRLVYGDDSMYKTLGDIVRRTKNIYNNNTRISSYILFGCPAIMITGPEHRESLISYIDTLRGHSDNDIFLNSPYGVDWSYEIEIYDVDQFFEYSRYFEPYTYSYTNRGNVIHSQSGSIGLNGHVVLSVGDIGEDASGISMGVYIRNGLLEFFSYIDNIHRLGNNSIGVSRFLGSNLEYANFSVTLGPNPIKDYLNVTVLNSDESINGKDLTISLFTIHGKKIAQKIVPINSLGEIETTFSTAEVNRGVFAIVFNVEGKKPQKFIFTKVE